MVVEVLWFYFYSLKNNTIENEWQTCSFAKAENKATKGQGQRFVPSLSLISSLSLLTVITNFLILITLFAKKTLTKKGKVRDPINVETDDQQETVAPIEEPERAKEPKKKKGKERLKLRILGFFLSLPRVKRLLLLLVPRILSLLPLQRLQQGPKSQSLSRYLLRQFLLIDLNTSFLLTSTFFSMYPFALVQEDPRQIL